MLSKWVPRERPQIKTIVIFKVLSSLLLHRASLMAQTVKNLLAMQDTQVQSLRWEDPWRREWQPTTVEWQPTPALLPGEFHGQRSLAGYSPWGRKESDTTEQLALSLSHNNHESFLLPTVTCNESWI